MVTVRGSSKFRVGSIVYTAFSQDESVMGFAFPKEERAALVDSDPRFHLPSEADSGSTGCTRRSLDLDPAEARELVVDAWRMVVPQKVTRAWDERPPRRYPADRVGRGARRSGVRTPSDAPSSAVSVTETCSRP